MRMKNSAWYEDSAIRIWHGIDWPEEYFMPGTGFLCAI